MKRTPFQAFAATLAAVALSVTLGLALNVAAVPFLHAQTPDRAPARTPDTPAGRRLAEFAEVVSAADSARTRAMVEESFMPEFRDAFPIAEHLELLGGLAVETGGVDVVAVQMRSPNEITALLRPRIEGRPTLRINLMVEPEPPHRIEGIQIMPGDDAPPPAPAGSPAEAARRLEAHVDSLAALDRFSGVVLFESDGEILLHKAWGQAEKAFGVPNQTDTKFNLGSMNKMFTAVTVARLIEEGALRLDDTIGEYLGSEWLRPGIGEKVTIEHLLTHTSGLGSYYSPELMELNPGRFRSIDDFQEIVRRDSLRFEPGTRWSYSNTGFLLLGAIIEKVTGRSYYDAVREYVYEPAGMTATDAYALDEPTPNLAIGYERSGGPGGGPEGPRGGPGGPRRGPNEPRSGRHAPGVAATEQAPVWRTNIYGHVVRGGPAGGGYSTAPDLLAFARALRENRLLSAEMTRRVTTPKPELASPEYGYGFGFWDEGRVVGHTGGAPGINAALQIDLERGTTLVALSNYGGAAIPVVRYADALLGYARDE
jgi:CubicO group peptidase (beta-lactamase class C family)